MIDWRLQSTYQHFYQTRSGFSHEGTWAGWWNKEYELKAVAGLSHWDGTVCYFHMAGSGGFFPRSLLWAVLDHAFTGIGGCQAVLCEPKECALRWAPALGFRQGPEGLWELTYELYQKANLRKAAKGS